MGRLFGTDGIRGVAGKSPLTLKEVLAIGRAAGSVLREKIGKGPIRILAVRDTRQSGPSILAKLSQGLREMGIDVHDAGVLSTPSAAFLVRSRRFQSGVVISASHNPAEFNGIKFFGKEGRKWPDEWELLTEKKIYALLKKKSVSRVAHAGSLIPAHNLSVEYQDFLINTLPADMNFKGLTIALDCSHGANYELAPQVFKELGAKLHVISAKPNGKNINAACGSQHTEKLAEIVKKRRCDAGVAFDGDGDRVIFVDEKGAQVDGDHIIGLLAGYFKRKKSLQSNKVVVTVMANLGLKKALAKMKVKTAEVPVGDRHVSAAMEKTGSILGGEQSGHIILGHFLPTGDGLLTALHVLAAYKEKGGAFSRMAGVVKKFPQVLLNVPVKERIPLEQLDGVSGKIRKIERSLGENGRVLVRYSGTEPLLRVMLEGPSKSQLHLYAEDIASSVKNAMGLDETLN